MRDKATAGVIAILFGGFGGHKFYLGQVGQGLLYLIFSWTFIPAFVGFLEGLGYLVMDTNLFNARYNPTMLPPMMAQPPPQQLAQSVVVNVPTQSIAANVPAVNLAEQLTKLNDLRIAGVLTEAEFASQKQKLLSG